MIIEPGENVKKIVFFDFVVKFYTEDFILR